MSWVNSDIGKGDAIQQLRGALIDEISATRLYDDLIKAFPKYADTLEEIKGDEINHQGRLLSLILKIDPKQMDKFNEGLEQKG